jgi:hypothetical protein
VSLARRRLGFDTLRLGKHTNWFVGASSQPTHPRGIKMHEPISLRRLILFAMVSIIGASARTRPRGDHADA